MDYTLSDIRAATEGNERGGMFGGDNDFLLIIVLFFFMMMFGGGFGGFGGNGALTRAEMQQGFDTQEVVRKLDGITNGLSDGFYAQNTTMLRGFADITTAVREGQFMAKDCCCETNRNIDGVRYDAQKNTCDIITAVHEEGEKTRSLIKENEIQVLRDKVAELQLAQSQCAQNAYLTNTIRPYPVPAYPACRPSCDGGWGWNYGGAA
jgi:hypothetical protein